MFENMIQEAVVYCRVSSQVQQERETIESQVEFAKKFCDLHKIEIKKIYKDDGITGTMKFSERPSGKELMQDAAAGCFKTVLVFKLDRLGRSASVILSVVSELDDIGVVVKSMTEPFDTSNASGKFLLTMLAGVAELDRANTLQRMWIGAQRAAKQGKWLGGIVPVGYRVDKDGYLMPSTDKIDGTDVSEVDVIRMIFSMCVDDNMSCVQIANRLNDMGIPNSYSLHGVSGKRNKHTRARWYQSGPYRIIKNEIYKGVHYYGKRTDKDRELIRRDVPALVTSDVWEKAQEVISSKRFVKKRGTRRYLLTGMIFCESCGHSYHGKPYGKDKPSGYYVCNGREAYKKMGNEKCLARSISVDWLDNEVWKRCLYYIDNPGVVAEDFGVPAEKAIDTKKQIELIEKKMRESEDGKARMLDLYRERLIGFDDLQDQLGKIKSEQDELRTAMRAVEEQANKDVSIDIGNAVDALTELQNVVRDADFETKRTVIETMIDSITVKTLHPGQWRSEAIVTIHFRFADIGHDDTTAIKNRRGKRVTRNDGMFDVSFSYDEHAGNEAHWKMREYCKEHHISTRELCRRAGITDSTWHRILRGLPVSKLSIEKFESVLDKPVEYFIGTKQK